MTPTQSIRTNFAPTLEPVLPPAPRAAPSAPEPTTDHPVERGGGGPDRARLFASARATASGGDEATRKRRVDDAQAAFSPPYTIGGGTVRVPTQFRMQGGHNDNPDASLLRAVPKGSVTNGEFARLRAGRATPDEIRKATQLLIDGGHLPKTNEPIAKRVQDMQWTYGIGIDCAGCVQQSLVMTSGKTAEELGLKGVMLENLSRLAHNPNFEQVDVRHARAGDVFVLGAPKPGDVGHTLLVAEHHVVKPGELPKLRGVPEDQVRAFCRPGSKVHVYALDASWGGGDKPVGAGVRRDVWLHDETTGQWACSHQDAEAEKPTRLAVSKLPYVDHPITGMFRVKGGS